MKKNSTILQLCLTILAVLTALIISLLLGSQKLTFSQFIQAFTQKDSFASTVIWGLRLPRSILVMISLVIDLTFMDMYLLLTLMLMAYWFDDLQWVYDPYVYLMVVFTT